MRRRNHLLRQCSDPRCGGISWRRKTHGLVANPKFSTIGPQRSGYDPYKGGFAGAVLPQQRVDLSALKREIDLIERSGAGEALSDAAKASNASAFTVTGVMLYLGTAKKTFAAKISKSCPGLAQ